MDLAIRHVTERDHEAEGPDGAQDERGEGEQALAHTPQDEQDDGRHQEEGV